MLEDGRLTFSDQEHKDSLKKAVDQAYLEVYSGKHDGFQDLDKKFGALQSVSYNIDTYVDNARKNETPAEEEHSVPTAYAVHKAQAPSHAGLDDIITEPAVSPSYSDGSANVYTPRGKKEKTTYSSPFTKAKKWMAGAMAAFMTAAIIYSCTPKSPEEDSVSPQTKTYQEDWEVDQEAYTSEDAMLHRVVEGENLTKIVHKFNAMNGTQHSLAEIAEHNKIVYDGKWFKIHPGQEIIFPSDDGTAENKALQGTSQTTASLSYERVMNDLDEEKFKKLCVDRIDLEEANGLIGRYGPSGLAWTLTGKRPEGPCKEDKDNLDLLRILQWTNEMSGIYVPDSDYVHCKGCGEDGLWDRLMNMDVKTLLGKVVIPESAYGLVIKEYLEPCDTVPEIPADTVPETLACPEIDTSSFTTMESIVMQQAPRS